LSREGGREGGVYVIMSWRNNYQIKIKKKEKKKSSCKKKEGAGMHA